MGVGGGSLLVNALEGLKFKTTHWNKRLLLTLGVWLFDWFVVSLLLDFVCVSLFCG